MKTWKSVHWKLIQRKVNGTNSSLEKYQIWITLETSMASLVAQTIMNLPANVGDPGFVPGFGRSPGERNGYPLQYSCLENPIDRGVWQVTVHEVAKSRTCDWVTKCTHAHMHTHTHKKLQISLIWEVNEEKWKEMHRMFWKTQIMYRLVRKTFKVPCW